ncbi:MAG: sensor histidine kinase [Desulfonatronovibrionaceae bacterium]
MFRSDPAHPFQLVKFLSWSSLILILASNLLVSVFVANYARDTVLAKNHSFALLLAENLNHQVYQRFTLPTVLGFGQIRLREKAQYDRLQRVIESTIHSFHVLDVRIYDNSGRISYAMDKELLGREDLAGEKVLQAGEAGEKFFVLEKKISAWKAMFDLDLEPNSVLLRTIYPLRAERRLGLKSQPIMGILTFTQDITADYETVVHFQWAIILATFISSLILFLILFQIIRRADRILVERSQEKERLEKELHQNEKLASMGRMVVGIAHEIRNPLGIIRSSSEFLYSRAKQENSSDKRLLKAVYDESRRLNRTVNDFLDYARPQQPRMADVDLGRVLREVVAFIHVDAENKSVDIQEHIPDGVNVRGDKDLLYRAFYNLVGNAIQAAPEQAGQVSLVMFEGGQGPVVEVCDNGPGFEVELLERYMEPFYTTKDSGTGLGLAIARNIFEGHGARIGLDSSDEGGAKVRVEFGTADWWGRDYG